MSPTRPQAGPLGSNSPPDPSGCIEELNESRALVLVGGIIAAAGGLVCAVAVIAVFAAGFDGGANIGAGLLLLLGVPVAVVGGSLLLVAAVGWLVRRRRRVSDARRGGTGAHFSAFVPSFRAHDPSHFRQPFGQRTDPSSYAHLVSSPHDDLVARMRAIVDEYGWGVQHVLPDAQSGEASFSYTIGLTARGWAELIITGLPPGVAEQFIRNAVDEQQEKGPFRAGDRSQELTESGSVVFTGAVDVRGMTATAAIVGSFTALQMVWPDSQGHLPWDADHRNPRSAQPLL